MTRDHEKASGVSSLTLESARKAAHESVQYLCYSEVTWLGVLSMFSRCDKVITSQRHIYLNSVCLLQLIKYCQSNLGYSTSKLQCYLTKQVSLIPHGSIN